MTDNKAASASTSLLMELPLEVRHHIFEYTTARDIKPKKLLRKWFEKKEIKELIANQTAADPNGPAPRVVTNNEYEEDSDVPEPEEDEGQDSEAEDVDDLDSEDNEDNDEEEDDEAEQDQDQEEEPLEDEVEAELDEEDEEGMSPNHTPQAQNTTQPLTLVQAQPLPYAQTATQAPGQVAATTGDSTTDADTQDHDGETGTSEVIQDEASADNDKNDDEEAANDDGANAATAAAPPPPPAPAPVIQAARKWRYIPNFMRITHCPPPVELLLASKQLNDEAKNWFYDVAILQINATGSFAHTSFFEEAFSQITDAAFSPMENVRKVESTFVWDTTWLRADTTGCAEAIFPALLRQRAEFVRQILSQAPDLREVTIHWHDSAQDEDAAIFMQDILVPFLSLNANVKVEEHYIAADAKPHKRSTAGKRRLEFQAIVDAGLDRLF
ncbi:hypothetical protein EK21DRAFT_54892 [Setomelanomma holmii]|uniref:Uncharacterized protein n=1 Tax=Setomelanomma holmii TaxID=210430 RepID=A0A9P4HLI6_9PLEO|nr:hypothetical protein EK21DRAFT_54892 [Setomelanomma holmii]